MRGEIGWVCSYTPVEIISASEFRPVRLATSPPLRTVQADAYLRSNLCPFVRGIFELLNSEGAPSLSGVVLTTSCDAMRRLADALTLSSKLDYLYIIEVPRASTESASSYFRHQLSLFRDSLKQRFGVRIDDEIIWKEIRAYNRRRDILRSIFLRLLDEGRGMGSFLPLLDRFFAGEEVEQTEEKAVIASSARDVEAGPSLLLSGSRIDQRELILLIEELGGRISALDLCNGERGFDFRIPEEGDDPLIALASGYLSRPPCARMGDITRRMRYLKELSLKRKVVGVIYHTIKFCDTQAYDLPLISSELALPLLHLETDCSSSFWGQLRTRIQAFIELLSG